VARGAFFKDDEIASDIANLPFNAEPTDVEKVGSSPSNTVQQKRFVWRLKVARDA
jgi:hypothetical protein